MKYKKRNTKREMEKEYVSLKMEKCFWRGVLHVNRYTFYIKLWQPNLEPSAFVKQ